MSESAGNAIGNRTHGSELQYQAVLDAAADAVIIIDAGGSIEFANRAAERLFGYRSDELLGNSINTLMPQPQRNEHDGYLHRYQRSREPHIIGIGREVTAQRRDGTTFAVELAVGEIKGATPHFVGFIRDIADRQRAENDVRQMRERLTHFGRIATMGEMAAGIAHEINQPLTAIATYAQACQRLLTNPTPPMSDIAAGLAQIEAQALRAGEVIRRLRSFVKNHEVRREPLDPNQFIEDLLMLAQTDTRHHHVQIRLELGENLPAVQADPVHAQMRRRQLLDAHTHRLERLHRADAIFARKKPGDFRDTFSK